MNFDDAETGDDRYSSYNENLPEEVDCVDCGCAIFVHEDGLYAAGIRGQPRCDTDNYHHHKMCGEDCPIICQWCQEHHFEGCYGASLEMLHERVAYGGRKGRSAKRRLAKRERLITKFYNSRLKNEE